MRIIKQTLTQWKAILLILFLFLLMVILGANYTIYRSTSQKTYDNASLIEKNKVGLVLGTTKMLQDGRLNLYFKYRVEATLDLYKKGKIDFVLISGDNSRKDYDEPTDFKNELVRLGVPENKIFLDYAGFRTLDSVVRAKEIFGQQKITIISQKFHNERAIYLAKKKGLNAIGFNAKDVSLRSGLKVKLREYLARTKVFIDLLFRVKPKFLGEKIIIS